MLQKVKNWVQSVKDFFTIAFVSMQVKVAKKPSVPEKSNKPRPNKGRGKNSK